MRTLALLFCLATPALAESPLTATAFETLVEGKTLSFSNGVAPYGSEYYAPDRRVIWAFTGGDCVNGIWHEGEGPDGPAICFRYENEPTSKCWHVYDENGKLRAEFIGPRSTTVLYEAIEADPLVCGGLGS